MYYRGVLLGDGVRAGMKKYSANVFNKWWEKYDIEVFGES